MLRLSAFFNFVCSIYSPYTRSPRTQSSFPSLSTRNTRRSKVAASIRETTCRALRAMSLRNTCPRHSSETDLQIAVARENAQKNMTERKRRLLGYFRSQGRGGLDGDDSIDEEDEEKRKIRARSLFMLWVQVNVVPATRRIQTQMERVWECGRILAATAAEPGSRDDGHYKSLYTDADDKSDVFVLPEKQSDLTNNDQSDISANTQVDRSDQRLVFGPCQRSHEYESLELALIMRRPVVLVRSFAEYLAVLRVASDAREPVVVMQLDVRQRWALVIKRAGCLMTRSMWRQYAVLGRGAGGHQ